MNLQILSWTEWCGLWAIFYRPPTTETKKNWNVIEAKDYYSLRFLFYRILYRVSAVTSKLGKFNFAAFGYTQPNRTAARTTVLLSMWTASHARYQAARQIGGLGSMDRFMLRIENVFQRQEYCSSCFNFRGPCIVICSYNKTNEMH